MMFKRDKNPVAQESLSLSLSLSLNLNLSSVWAKLKVLGRSEGGWPFSTFVAESKPLTQPRRLSSFFGHGKIQPEWESTYQLRSWNRVVGPVVLTCTALYQLRILQQHVWLPTLIITLPIQKSTTSCEDSTSHRRVEIRTKLNNGKTVSLSLSSSQHITTTQETDYSRPQHLHLTSKK